ncbi:MAG: hypothetical protein KatS3mg113_0133 [Planctomycetaceae bacterium]|nr:MAG: hypothetical protein KatS3mg113_0133 [Planctomycetaceae bacterium]
MKKPASSSQSEAPDPSTESLSFEQAIHQLEAITRQLEEGGLSLEESLAAYERGVRLLRICHQKLQQAELQVEQLLKVDPQGKIEIAPLEFVEEKPEPEVPVRRRRLTPRIKPSESSPPSE